MSVFNCFTDVIGITRKQDACVAGSFADNSLSGLYLDELRGLGLRILNTTGGNFTLLEKAENARENGINAFKVDVMAKILETREPARGKFIGDIGGKSFSTVLSTDTYHGLRMYSDVIGGSFTLRGVTLMLNVSEAVNLLIYSGETDQDGAAALYTIPLVSIAGRQRYNAITPIELPLDGNYYFLYQTTGLPYNNHLTCNCGGHKWCFNIKTPCYRPSRDKWTEWSMAAGVHGSDLSERDDWPVSRDGQGIILHGEFGCDTLGILCSDHSDWSGNEIDSAIAWAILYKAGSFLTTYVMDSEEINKYTLLGVDGLSANIAFYEERYRAMIDFIAANIETNRNECLRCKSPQGYRRQAQML